jgi:hypothetical protein
LLGHLVSVTISRNDTMFEKKYMIFYAGHLWGTWLWFWAFQRSDEIRDIIRSTFLRLGVLPRATAWPLRASLRRVGPAMLPRKTLPYCGAPNALPYRVWYWRGRGGAQQC